jgi:hypothetical protein
MNLNWGTVVPSAFSFSAIWFGSSPTPGCHPGSNVGSDWPTQGESTRCASLLATPAEASRCPTGFASSSERSRSRAKPTYELAGRTTAVGGRGLGAFHRLVRRIGLPRPLKARLDNLERAPEFAQPERADEVLALALKVEGAE